MVAYGATTIAEDATSQGRIDLTVIAENRTFIVEFKLLDGDTGDGRALQQIRERGYADKYRGETECYLVGIEFSKQQRNIVGFEWEQPG